MNFKFFFPFYILFWDQLCSGFKKDEKSLISQLYEKGFMIREVKGDGNCMFRAISDQLYGNEDYHFEVRKYALEYISLEQEFFKDFIIGDIDKYVEEKLKNGVWGDHLELVAIKQLLDIPIEIYYDSSEPMRNGLEISDSSQEPIRLSYHNKSHYNSVKLINDPNRKLFIEKPGVMEEKAIQKVKQSREKGNK